MPLRRHPWCLRLRFEPLPPRKTASCKSKPKSRSKLTEMHDRSIPRSRCCSLRPGLLASARLLNVPKASLLGSQNRSSGLQSCISVSFDREMKIGFYPKGRQAPGGSRRSPRWLGDSFLRHAAAEFSIDVSTGLEILVCVRWDFERS